MNCQGVRELWGYGGRHENGRILNALEPPACIQPPASAAHLLPASGETQVYRVFVGHNRGHPEPHAVLVGTLHPLPLLRTVRDIFGALRPQVSTGLRCCHRPLFDLEYLLHRSLVSEELRIRERSSESHNAAIHTRRTDSDHRILSLTEERSEEGSSLGFHPARGLPHRAGHSGDHEGRG